MRAKKMAVVCIATLSLTMLAGCTRLSETDKVSSVDEVAEFARQAGYNQAYIEMAYGTGKEISEEDYNKYLETKEKYEADKTWENLQEVVKATQKILQNEYACK